MSKNPNLRIKTDIVDTNIRNYRTKFETLHAAIKKKKGITTLHMTDLLILLIEDGLKKYVK